MKEGEISTSHLGWPPTSIISTKHVACGSGAEVDVDVPSSGTRLPSLSTRSIFTKALQPTVVPFRGCSGADPVAIS